MQHYESSISTIADCKAIADLGSNTFHLLVGRFRDGKKETIFHRKEAVGIGLNGMALKLILPDALERAVKTLQNFAEDLENLGINPAEVDVFATSAFRNAVNADEVLEEIKIRTGFCPKIISGEEEASLIFFGVMGSGAIFHDETSLIVDIGGGSVEFILCDGMNPVWKQSFETGGLRLMEQFHQIDPIPENSLTDLKIHALEVLEPLWEKISVLKNLQIIGCSGSFDTLVDMRNASIGSNKNMAENQALHSLSRAEFLNLYEALSPLSMEERLAFPGMIPLRAGMMVVAMALIHLLLEKSEADTIRVSTYSLKEGALFKHFSNG